MLVSEVSQDLSNFPGLRHDSCNIITYIEHFLPFLNELSVLYTSIGVMGLQQVVYFVDLMVSSNRSGFESRRVKSHVDLGGPLGSLLFQLFYAWSMARFILSNNDKTRQNQIQRIAVSTNQPIYHLL